MSVYIEDTFGANYYPIVERCLGIYEEGGIYYEENELAQRIAEVTDCCLYYVGNDWYICYQGQCGTGR